MTPSHRYEAAATSAQPTCNNNNMKVKDRKSKSISDLRSEPDNTVRLGGSLTLRDIPNTDSTDTLTPTIVPAPEAPHNIHKTATAPTTPSTNQEHMDTSTTTMHLSTCYYQTRNARRALNNHITHNWTMAPLALHGTAQPITSTMITTYNINIWHQETTSKTTCIRTLPACSILAT